MTSDPFAHQAVELLELTRAVDATQRVIHLGIFRLRSGECRAALQSRRALCFRAISSELVPDTAESRASHAAARATLYGHASGSFSLERVALPEALPPLPWLPPQDATTTAEIDRLEAHLDFDSVSEATTAAFTGLGRRFLVSVVPGRDRDLACLLERSVRASDAGDVSIQLAHVCARRDVDASFSQLRAYARSLGIVEVPLR